MKLVGYVCGRKKTDVKFENKVEWGINLNSKHERYICGKVVGGSQGEESYDVINRMIDEKGMDKEGLQWYMDFRRYGGCKHADFGLVFDRF